MVGVVLYCLQMTCLVTSKILDEIHITENIEIMPYGLF